MKPARANGRGLRRELAEARGQTEEESRQRRKLVEKIAEVEYAKAELVAQVDAASEVVKRQESSLRSLETRLHQAEEERRRLDAQFQSECAQHRQLRTQTDALEQQAAELNRRLTEQVAECRTLEQQREELQHRVRVQTDQLAEAASLAALQESTRQQLQSSLDDAQVIQSALCARVRELTRQQEAGDSRIQELQGQTKVAAQTLHERDQQVASLRFAMLDAMRIGGRMGQARRQSENHALAGWKELLNTLLQTPLSLTQRGVVAELDRALDGWKLGRGTAADGFGLQFRPPNLGGAEFDGREVLEAALADARSAATQGEFAWTPRSSVRRPRGSLAMPNTCITCWCCFRRRCRKSRASKRSTCGFRSRTRNRTARPCNAHSCFREMLMQKTCHAGCRALSSERHRLWRATRQNPNWRCKPRGSWHWHWAGSR